ncbi:MAG: TatD family hydrolase [Bacteroidetes bacterium]|nr:TatD family hydrolase [Bacteroidota bacterium]
MAEYNNNIGQQSPPKGGGGAFNAHTHKNSPNAIINTPLGSIDFEENLHYSIGIHPWDYMKYCENTEMLQHWLQNSVILPQVVAIGECGIDRSIDIEVELQEDLFVQHIKLARHHNKPLIIHSVRAYNDILKMLEQTDCRQPIVFHKFTGNQQIYDSFKDFDCYYSFGAEMFTRVQSVKMVQTLPLEKLLFENDDADVSIDEVYAFAAQKLCISVETLRETVQRTAEKVFGL